MKEDNFTFGKLLRIFIWILLALMLIVVVYDRYIFHNYVYNKAAFEVAELEQTKKSCPSFCMCRHHIDSIAKSHSISSSAEASNTNNICQSVNVNDEASSFSKMEEGESSLFNLMKDVDGLISANGLTFLISLIVALLIALVTDRIGAMEKLSSQITTAKETTEKNNTKNQKLQEEVRTSLEKTKKELENINNANDELQEKVKTSLVEMKKETTDLYNHLAVFDKLLVRVESLFNLAITIGSVTRVLSLLDFGNDDAKNSLATVIGTLCSRLTLCGDLIGDIFYNSEKKIDYLSEEEKNILSTYLLDAKDELNNSRKMVKSYQHLSNLLGDCRRMVEEIHEKIESWEDTERVTKI